MKRIDSPVKRWPGYVLLKDPLPLILKADFDDALQEARAVSKKPVRAFVIILPALLPCVAEWHLENFPTHVTLETFPGAGSDINPVDPITLLGALISGVIKIYEPPKDADPNA